jgi:hypothetical protein
LGDLGVTTGLFLFLFLSSATGVLPNPSHLSYNMPRSQLRFEEVDGLCVPLGGINGYKGVRGKQGRKKNKFQGVTPRKQHRTGPKDTPKEAAVALAHLWHDLELGIVEERSRKSPQPPVSTAAHRKMEVGTYLGHLLRQPPTGIPTVVCALLSQQEAAEAAACGVAVAYARVRA